jgi:tetratricopeptide (TPR) repeat protein
MRNNRRIFSLTLALALTLSLAAHAGWQEGVSAFQAGNYAQAAEEFRTVVEGQPEWPGGHLMLGRSLLKLQRSQEALTHLRKAYDLQPEDVATQMILGQAYVQSRRYRDAGELLGKVNVASLPKAQQGPLHQMRAVAYDKTGQTDRAIQELAKAVQLNPNNADLQFQYGTLMFNNGNTATSVRSLEKAVSLDSSDAAKQKAYADALLRHAREQRGTAKTDAYQKAVSAASRLVSSSDSYGNLMLLGGAQLGAQAYPDAAATFQRAAGKNNRDWLPHFYIGQALTAAGGFRQAETALHEALTRTEVSEETNRIWRQLGFVYEKLKDYGQAKTAYEKANDRAGVQRVETNQETERHNTEVEAEKAEIDRLKAEEAALEQALKELEQGEVPPGM